jgi:hypothetical protein
LTAVALLLATIVGGGVFTVDHRKEDWRSIAATVSRLPDQRRLLLFVSADGQLPFDYYYRLRPNEVETGLPAGFFDVDPPRTMLRVKSSSNLDVIAGWAREYPEIDLIQSHQWFADPDGSVLNRLQSEMKLAPEPIPDDGSDPQVTVYRFVPNSPK